MTHNKVYQIQITIEILEAPKLNTLSLLRGSIQIEIDLTIDHLVRLNIGTFHTEKFPSIAYAHYII